MLSRPPSSNSKSHQEGKARFIGDHFDYNPSICSRDNANIEIIENIESSFNSQIIELEVKYSTSYITKDSKSAFSNNENTTQEST